MTFSQLTALFAAAGCTKLYAKSLAENDNSKNQVYFAGAVEALQVFPCEQIYAENTKKGPSFKARLNFGWLLENCEIAPAPSAQLILYSQYPEVRFSGFLEGCKAGPSVLMADRKRAEGFPNEVKIQLVGRILFLGVTANRRVIGHLVAGNSIVAAEFNARVFPQAFVVFREIPLPHSLSESESRARLIAELHRIHGLGWINSKQLHSDGTLKPCTASQCGGFTLEAELGIAKNSQAAPDFHGWEIKQHAVSNFDTLVAGAITLMTPEPNGGFYVDEGVPAFIRKFGYPDRNGIPDRLNFGGIHKVGACHPTTELTLMLTGYDSETDEITDANGAVSLLTLKGEVAASWSFSDMFQHWSKKHAKAAYVPSQSRQDPAQQYRYGSKVRLAVGTNSLLLLKAFATGAVYYDPGIKLENASGPKPKDKRRSQFRIVSKNIPVLYQTVESISLNPII
jgi:hypothetical protein